MDEKIAIVLNGNARSVTESVVKILQSTVPQTHVFISTSLEHSVQLARQILKKKFTVVFCGGGDGTFSQIASDIFALKPKKMPSFGILRLGTGNGMAWELGVPEFNHENLLRGLAQAKNPSARINNFSLLKIENKLAPFAGMGMDAQVMQDYGFVKKWMDKIPWLRSKWRGPVDYAVATLSLSFWRYLRDSFALPRVTIKNGGETRAHYVSTQGRMVGDPIQKGAKIHEGTIAIALFSTVSCIGWGMNLFSQASVPEKPLKLRIADLNVYEALKELPLVLFGRSENTKDYISREIIIEAHEPGGIPCEMAGTPIGKRERIVVGIENVTMVSGPDALAPELPK